VLSEEGARSFLEMCPQSEFVNVSDAAHMVAGDRNDIFSGAVIEFLSRTVPIGGQPVQAAHEPHPHHEGPPGDVLDLP
jgi:non-heme chloroperoxidase